MYIYVHIYIHIYMYIYIYRKPRTSNSYKKPLPTQPPSPNRQSWSYVHTVIHMRGPHLIFPLLSWVIYVYAIKKVASYVYAMKSSRARVRHAPEIRWRTCHFGWILLGLNSCTHLTCGTHVVKRLLCPCPIRFVSESCKRMESSSRAPVRAPVRPEP
jgi:hypothetical protein